MAEQNQLSLEEMLKLARKIEFWEEIGGGAYEKYRGNVGDLCVEVGIVYCLVPIRGMGGKVIGYEEEGELVGKISVFGGGSRLGVVVDDKVNPVVYMAEDKYLKRIKKDETQLIKETKEILKE